MRRLVLAALLAALVGPASAQATFPGANGKIAFVRGGDIWTMDPDGTDQVNLTNTAATERGPAWSPDGTKIAFVVSHGISVINADGTGRTSIPLLPNTGATGLSWSPDGTQIVYAGCCPPGHDFALVRMNADGSGATVIADALKGLDAPDWSPDGARIVYEQYDACNLEAYLTVLGPGGGDLVGGECVDDDQSATTAGWSPGADRIAYANDASLCGSSCAGRSGIWTIKRDGTGQQQLASGPYGQPVYSPDGSRIAFGGIKVMNADGTGITDIASGGEPDWQPIPINTYPRPRGASPFRVALVPAYEACTSPNDTHAAPLDFGSCDPPARISQYLTTGTPDANNLSVRMDAYLLLKVLAGNSSTPADEADVQITAEVNDVKKTDLTDYTGGLRAELPLRITDRDNTPSPVPHGAGTTRPFQYGFDVPCVADPDPRIGSDCSITTTADTLVPGTIKEGLRTVWQIGRARVDDGGADGDPSTTGDNTVFAVQGVFIP
jgi:WD40 repeat protein